jgi:hypothetical protein
MPLQSLPWGLMAHCEAKIVHQWYQAEPCEISGDEGEVGKKSHDALI